jgi:hypothetical protein
MGITIRTSLAPSPTLNNLALQTTSFFKQGILRDQLVMYFSIPAWKHLSSLVLLSSIASTGLALPAAEAEAGLDLEKRGLLGSPCPEDLLGKWACATNGESIVRLTLSLNSAES